MEPGVYKMTFDEYRKADGVNASLLAHFEQSPAHAKDYMDTPQEETLAMKLGTLAHKFILEPEDVAMSDFAIRPEGMDYRTKEGKAWKAEKLAAGKRIITFEERAQIVGMVSAIIKHPIARNAFATGESEVSLFCPFTFGGTVMRKGRLDFLTQGTAVVDLKTTEDARRSAFEKSIANFLYHMKAAYYLDIAKDLGLPHRDFVFVAVEKHRPHGVMVYQLETEDIQTGRGLYLKFLSQYIECRDTNHWPGYPEKIEVIGLPKWAKQAA